MMTSQVRYTVEELANSGIRIIAPNGDIHLEFASMVGAGAQVARLLNMLAECRTENSGLHKKIQELENSIQTLQMAERHRSGR